MSVSVTTLGFTLNGHAVDWEAVRAVAVYKRDLYVYDNICLAFKLSDDSWVEVSEEEPGFSALAKAVERRFPTVPRDWFRQAMFPAFATNYSVLWGEA
jgi:hypothetical protein